MSLGCALSLSKYCRDVILGSKFLRRQLLIEPALATDDLEVVVLPTWLPFLIPFTPLHPCVLGNENSSEPLVIRSHPNVVPLINVTPHRVHVFPKQGVTHAISPEAMKAASPRQSIFEPPLRDVKVFYRGQKTRVGRWGGVTFGAIVEELRQMRKDYQDRIAEIGQSNSAHSNRAACAQALEELNGPLDGCWWGCHADEEDPFIYIGAERKVTFLWGSGFEVRALRKEPPVAT